jgi:hypothetical protein
LRKAMKNSHAKKYKKAKTFGKNLKDVEIKQGAWQRFTALIKNAVKMGHKPHSSSGKRKSKTSSR